MNKGLSATDKKEITKQKLIDAVGRILSKEGFKGLGVNKVAREAGMDKVLVYRYFGGLPQLVLAYSQTGDFWPTKEELIGEDLELLKQMPFDRQMAEFFKRFLRAIRKRPQTQEILAWEVLERNELTKQLEQVRIKTILEYFDCFDNLPDTIDLSAIVVLMAGAVNYLIIKSRIHTTVGGIDLTSNQGWDRMETGIDLLLKGIFDD
ncbi:MAG: TetR/AcrR family transcriptional regulator [Desulfobacteraceae bacterium]|nr:TetR/AcrR family transcriptional regulator [Desulfobacteraceae bacterium]